MKYLITERQAKKTLSTEDIDTQFSVIKNFLEKIPPYYSDVTKIVVRKPKVGDQVVVTLVFKPKTPVSKIEETLDKTWDRIYNYLGLTVAVSHIIEGQV